MRFPKKISVVCIGSVSHSAFRPTRLLDRWWTKLVSVVTSVEHKWFEQTTQ